MANQARSLAETIELFMKLDFNPIGDEKKALKILFWCITPILFFVFLRLFWVLFGFIYGGLLSLVLGSRFIDIIAVFSFLTSLVFTVLTCRWLYLQFKKHIIGNN